MPDATLDNVLQELTSIKRLMIFALLQQEGISQAQVAAALGIAQSQVSKLMNSKN